MFVEGWVFGRFGVWVVGLVVAMLLLQYVRTMTCLWIWLLGVWCGCGASYACPLLFTNYPLFSNVMIRFMPVDGAAAWPGVVFSAWILGAAAWWPLCGSPTM